MPRILVTNDDGVHSEGIHALAAALRRLGEVIVVAPHIEASAIGHALTLRRPLRLEQLRDGVYEVDGTPTDCVNIAFTKLFETPPDLVVSGINKGYNLGDDVTYSGTVSGALEGALLGVPSDRRVAQRNGAAGSTISRTRPRPPRPVAETGAARRAPGAARSSASTSRPGRPKGFKHHGPGPSRNHVTIVDERVDPRGKAYYWIEEGAERLGAARSVRLPGGQGRLRLRHAAAARHDRLQRAGAARRAFGVEGSRGRVEVEP